MLSGEQKFRQDYICVAKINKILNNGVKRFRVLTIMACFTVLDLTDNFVDEAC